MAATKAERIAAYTVRTCDGCGISDEEAMEAGTGFWLFEGGGECGACIISGWEEEAEAA